MRRGDKEESRLESTLIGERREFVEWQEGDVSKGDAPIRRRRGRELMDVPTDGWTAGTRRQILNLYWAASRTIAYLYYKTAINSGIHYHKLDRHRVVHVSQGMPRKRNNVYYNKAPGLFTIALRRGYRYPRSLVSRRPEPMCCFCCCYFCCFCCCYFSCRCCCCCCCCCSSRKPAPFLFA